MKMKKILLCSAAILGVSAVAAPAMAQVDVTVGGHTKNYVGFLSQDDVDERNFDMLTESEVHFNAEGTADNGLTYGFHVETEADGSDSFEVEESYLYLASSLGRVNMGSEDGANYLLQVAAPSADANIDGLRQYINPVINQGELDYANDITGQDEKITYLSPNWSGFQFGLSYTPEVADDNGAGVGGFNLDDQEDNQGSGYEGSVRYEGTFNNVGFAVGAGYSHIDIEEDVDNTSDDIDQWNIGADFDIGAFGVGAAYTETESAGAVPDADVDTIVVGADYTTGPFQFGASYLNQDADNDDETDRYTGGVVYTLTQGLTLRGSISYSDLETAGGADSDATSVLGGIQFNF
jgi:predicted porin